MLEQRKSVCESPSDLPTPYLGSPYSSAIDATGTAAASMEQKEEEPLEVMPVVR